MINGVQAPFIFQHKVSTFVIKEKTKLKNPLRNVKPQWIFLISIVSIKTYKPNVFCHFYNAGSCGV